MPSLAAVVAVAAQAQNRPPAGVSSVVAATVNGESLESAEVTRVLRERFGAQRTTGEALDRLQAQALEVAIDELALQQYLKTENCWPTDAETDANVNRIRLEAMQQSRPGETAKQKFDPNAVRGKIAVLLAISKYVQKTMGADGVTRYCEEHRKEFDGTQQRISHILFRSAGPTDEQAVRNLTNLAQQIRDLIANGTINFAAAARRYSSGPSRRRGGDLGFIVRDANTLDAFATAAFTLDQGELSQPVVTPLGVHLILCTDTKPGQASEYATRAAAEAKLLRETVETLTRQQRAAAHVEYTGQMPHFDPQSKRLLRARPAAKTPQPSSP